MPREQSDEQQLQKLARRIAWLDRFRRPLAILFAIVVSQLGIWSVFGGWPDDWPRVHLGMLSVMLGFVAWWAIEAALGFVLAIWETDHNKLTKPAELPRAEVVRRK